MFWHTIPFTHGMWKSYVCPTEVVAGSAPTIVPLLVVALSKNVAVVVPAVVISTRHKRPGVALITVLAAATAMGAVESPPYEVSDSLVF